MARKTTSSSAADTPGDAAVASREENAALEHTEGGVTTRDGMDAGVPMIAGAADEPIGPEDAFGVGPKRGNYAGRVDRGPHMETRVIPEAEREENGPIYELVEQGSRATEQGDETGKGGVSTQAAQDHAAELAAAPAGPSREDAGDSGDSGDGNN